MSQAKLHIMWKGIESKCPHCDGTFRKSNNPTNIPENIAKWYQIDGGREIKQITVITFANVHQLAYSASEQSIDTCDQRVVVNACIIQAFVGIVCSDLTFYIVSENMCTLHLEITKKHNLTKYWKADSTKLVYLPLTAHLLNVPNPNTCANSYDTRTIILILSSVPLPLLDNIPSAKHYAICC